MRHPTARLDNTVHQRVRLGILTVLSEADRADFAYLREALGLTDGNLSRNLRVLEQAGYVAIEKTFEGRRPRTWVSATRRGRKALADELSALRELIAGVESGVTGERGPARDRGSGRRTDGESPARARGGRIRRASGSEGTAA